MSEHSRALDGEAPPLSSILYHGNAGCDTAPISICRLAAASESTGLSGSTQATPEKSFKLSSRTKIWHIKFTKGQHTPRKHLYDVRAPKHAQDLGRGQQLCAGAWRHPKLCSTKCKLHPASAESFVGQQGIRTGTRILLVMAGLKLLDLLYHTEAALSEAFLPLTSSQPPEKFRGDTEAPKRLNRGCNVPRSPHSY